MSAKEMFENLGYIFEDRFDGLIRKFRYVKDEENVIIFLIQAPDYFKIKTFYKTGMNDSYCDDITIEELKAINKQVEELGWLEEVEE